MCPFTTEDIINDKPIKAMSQAVLQIMNCF